MKRKIASKVILLSAAALYAHSGHAQEPGGQAQPLEGQAPDVKGTAAAPASGVEEIVVTAQRRGENLQKVPISITAVTASRLEDAGIQSTANLTAVAPGLQFQQSVGEASPFIRGIGSQSNTAGYEASVATYVDGVYIATGASALMSLNNIERIEVLKGPQGTLFARNSSGGLIQIITRTPKYRPELVGSVSYDQFETVAASAYATTGITDNVAVDLAARYSHQDQGWGVNRQTGTDVNKVDHDFAVRSKILVEPSDSTRLVIAGDFSDLLASTFVTYAPIPGTTTFTGYQFGPGNPRDIDSDVDPYRKVRNWGLSADLTQKLGFATLRSITAFRENKIGIFADPEATPLPAIDFDSRFRQRQFSQELQLLSSDESSIKWIVGAFYYRNRGEPVSSFYHLYPGLTGAPGVIFDRQIYPLRTTSVAGFAQVTVPITDKLHATGGIRYTRDKFSAKFTDISTLSFVPPPFNTTTTVDPDRHGRSSEPSWRLALDYQLTSDALLYASYNRGFKSGGFSPQEPFSSALSPEIVDAYEIGAKIDGFDRAMRLNIATFYNKVKDLQLVQYATGTGGVAAPLLLNAANAKSYGVEVEATFIPVKGLTLFAGGSLLHSEYPSFPGAPTSIPLPAGGNLIVAGDASGNRTVRQPDKTLTLSATYDTSFAGGMLGLSGTYFRSTRWYADPDNRAFQPAYSQVSGQIRWTEPSGHVTFRIFGRNLTNAEVVGEIVSSFSTGDTRTLTEPRTIGGAVDFKF